MLTKAYYKQHKMKLINRTKLKQRILKYRMDNDLSTYKVRLLESNGISPFGVSLNTIYSILKDKPVSKQSIIQICYKLDIPFLQDGKKIIIK